jgi:hypothetical protein
MKNLHLTLTCLLCALTIVSCSEDNSTDNQKKPTPQARKNPSTREELWKEIKIAEDSMYKKQQRNRISNIHYMTYFSQLIEYYNKYPKDAKADSCLMALCTTETGYPIGHGKHLVIQEQYGDTLLIKYPQSKFRIFVIQDLIYKYDQAINNKRDIKKIKSYYDLWIKALPKTPEGQQERKEIEERLKNIDEPVVISK